MGYSTFLPLSQKAVCRWGNDPFSGGAYSFWATGSCQDDNDRLADPIGDGRVLFAGEATSDVGYFATVHGAYWSGQREAQRILRGDPNAQVFVQSDGTALGYPQKQDTHQYHAGAADILNVESAA